MLHAHIENTAELVIAQGWWLDDIATSNEIKNIHQVKHSSVGSDFDDGKRLEAEALLFGYEPYDHQKQKFPQSTTLTKLRKQELQGNEKAIEQMEQLYAVYHKYGAINLYAQPFGALHSKSMPITFVLKRSPDVLRRITLTPYDSLKELSMFKEKHLGKVPVGTMSNFDHVLLSRATDYGRSYANAKSKFIHLLKWLLDPTVLADDVDSHSDLTSASYLEFQIHGRVTLDDVQAVRADFRLLFGNKEFAKLRKVLLKKGAKIHYYLTEGMGGPFSIKHPVLLTETSQNTKMFQKWWDYTNAQIWGSNTHDEFGKIMELSVMAKDPSRKKEFKKVKKFCTGVLKDVDSIFAKMTKAEAIPRHWIFTKPIDGTSAPDLLADTIRQLQVEMEESESSTSVDDIVHTAQQVFSEEEEFDADDPKDKKKQKRPSVVNELVAVSLSSSHRSLSLVPPPPHLSLQPSKPQPSSLTSSPSVKPLNFDDSSEEAELINGNPVLSDFRRFVVKRKQDGRQYALALLMMLTNQKHLQEFVPILQHGHTEMFLKAVRDIVNKFPGDWERMNNKKLFTVYDLVDKLIVAHFKPSVLPMFE